MDQITLDAQLKSLTRLSFEEQKKLSTDLQSFYKIRVYPWWWVAPCVVNVLVVTDGGLNFGPNGSGLSNFITIFKKLEQQSPVHIRYDVTLAHLTATVTDANMQVGNPDIKNTIKDFVFDDTNYFTATKYDQVWLFGIATSFGSAFQYPRRNASPTYPSDQLSPSELAVLQQYMDGGGGLFATGDHGTLGKAMCGEIVRVKDMRYWDNTDPNNNLNEVSMNGARRNDTNTPPAGQTSSTNFNDQSDDLPQNIHARLYGGVPHPLLRIKSSIYPSGIINIMPDHPHEGQCQPETNFTVTHPSTGAATTIRTQNIALSFVPAGNTAGGKAATEPHCFPGIGVWDGCPAKHGRVVVDATWHHFVNVNLIGFTAATYAVIEQYYMNIAKWMTRKKVMLCRLKRIIFPAVYSERVIESATMNPNLALTKMPLNQLHSIGIHARDFAAEAFAPGDADEFFSVLLEEVYPDLATKLNKWDVGRDASEDDPATFKTDFEAVAAIAIGAGLLNVLQTYPELTQQTAKDQEAAVNAAFDSGLSQGLDMALESLEAKVDSWKVFVNARPRN